MNHWCYTQLIYIYDIYYIWYIIYVYYIYIPLSGDIANNITGVLYDYYKFLVGGFKPSWKIWKSMRRIMPYIMQNKSHVPNHQQEFESMHYMTILWLLGGSSHLVSGFKPQV